MSEAEGAVGEFKRVLGSYGVNAEVESLFALRDILRVIEKLEMLEAIGCNHNCPLCSWGDPAAKPWENHCRFWAFQELLEDADPGRRRGNALVQHEAVTLLAALKERPLAPA